MASHRESEDLQRSAMMLLAAAHERAKEGLAGIACGQIARMSHTMTLNSHSPELHGFGCLLMVLIAAQGRARDALQPLEAAREVLQASLGTDYEAVGEAQFYSALANLHLTDRSDTAAVDAFDPDLLQVIVSAFTS